jgi:hypothetical protein
VTITNTTSSAVSVAIAPGSPAAPFSVPSPQTCPASLAGNGGTCTLNVVFAPTAPGAAAPGTLTLNIAGNPVAVTLNGTVIDCVVGPDFAFIAQDSTGNLLDVAANDTCFSDPVTLGVTVPPTHGTATPTGGGPPGTGNQSVVRISYTPSPGYQGADSFTYSITSGANTKTAAVTINVLPPHTVLGAVTSPVKGLFGRAGQGCLQLLAVNVGDGENCLYNGGPIVNSPPLAPYSSGEGTGPYSQEAFYDSIDRPDAFSVAYKEVPNDRKIHQLIDGTVTIDDQGTANPADDLISFSITMRSPGQGDVIRQLGSTNTSAEDKYTTMTQVLAPYRVDFASPNASGGFDYVIGSAGFPTRLVFNDPYSVDPDATNPAGTLGGSQCNGQLFGDVDCTASFTAIIRDPLRWTPWSSPGSGRPGISRMEGNIGARTVGSVTGFDCIDSGTNNACKISKVSFAPLVKGPNNTPGGGTSAEDVGWDDLYLKVSTDSSGKVISMEGYPVQEYQVFAQPTWCGSDPGATFNCNSWLAEHFDAQGVVADNDGPIEVFAGASKNISVLSNDRGFVGNNITVTIVSQPTKGPAVTVNGSPGPASGISVTYTAGTNATAGPDSFVYRVDDGTHSDQATVRINVTRSAIARNDSATTSVNTPLTIAVLANDTGFSNPVTVGMYANPLHGSAQVIGSPGPQSGVSITYTPTAGFAGADAFQYAISDGVNVGIATVVVTVIHDSDGDGVSDDFDNCINVFNPDQQDSDGDGYGNVCDGDLNNDGIVNFADLAIFRQKFGTHEANADFDGNGVVEFADLAKFRNMFGKPPGPSGFHSDCPPTCP